MIFIERYRSKAKNRKIENKDRKDLKF